MQVTLWGEYNKEPVGSCTFSSICVFSFHPVKIITTGEGGAATTNDQRIYQLMCNFRSHGITKDPNKFLNSRNEPGFMNSIHLDLIIGLVIFNVL